MPIVLATFAWSNKGAKSYGEELTLDIYKFLTMVSFNY